MRRIEVVFSYGFRIFFVSAAAWAVVLMTAWAGSFAFGWPVAGTQPLSWHAHETLFGVVGAAIAGFLLTATPNWTGTRRLHGPTLVGLWLLWAAARVGHLLIDPVGAGAWPLALRLVDLAFLPGVALFVASPIIESGNRRNLVMVVLLTLLFTANLLHDLPEFSRAAALLGVDLVLVMMALIGGRITPAFTANWMQRNGISGPAPIQRGWLDASAIGALVATTLLAQWLPGHVAVGVLALLAAALNLVRLAGWQGWRTGRDPLVWVLHLGYFWIPIALALRGAGVLIDSVPANAWLHAAGVGGMGTLILGVMARVALGHTGRALSLPSGAVWMFVLITVAAAARVAGALGLIDYMTALIAAAVGWIAAFFVYLVVYFPILTAPRVDGRPG